MLSVIVITKNEEKNIRECLESVRFADEIVVYDAHSTDRTATISREFTNKVFEGEKWEGFGPQKQKALDLATHEWVLSIDADERVSVELREEILKTIKSATHTGYYLPRLSFVCGQPIRHGGWYPDHIVRLFRRAKGKFSNDVVHEKILVDGPLGYLKNHILHHSYGNLSRLIEKMDIYSSLGAEKLMRSGKKGSVLAAFVRAVFAFFKSYVLKLGFLDGTMGLAVAVSSAETVYYKYFKLKLLNKS